ncbi:transmembrane amino acid transporter protein-domain-containing protein [Choanephora cucurbitarum]|nr:transmembrane amino acid transporter protein-domain-containing protein [Choanephora cucurbitarum]
MSHTTYRKLDHDPGLDLLPTEGQHEWPESSSTFIEPTTLYIQDYEEQQATATPASCMINLANTILGTGMLAMPSAMASVGILPGIFLILFSALASGTGLYFLSVCARRTEGRHASFFALSQLTWPSIAVIDSFTNHADTWYFLTDRRFWITFFMLTLILPLSFLKRLDSLKYTSLIALVAVIYLCVIVLYHYLSPDYPPPEQVELANLDTTVLGHLPVFVFAFTCHQNIFSVYNELRDNSQFSITKVIVSSIGGSAFVYEAIAILGYLSFGKSVRGNIIMEYPSSYFVAGGSLATVISVIFSYPLQAHPCRASLDKVLALLSPSTKFISHPPPPPSAFKHFAMTTVILIASYLVAITVTELDLVLSFVGSTGSTIISFILPGMFYYKLHQNSPWHSTKVIAILLAVYGTFIMTVCLTFNIMRLTNSVSSTD